MILRVLVGVLGVSEGMAGTPPTVLVLIRSSILRVIVYFAFDRS